MLIREAQINEFRKQSEEEFIEGMARDLRTNHPDRTSVLDDKELRRRVEFGLRKAQKYEMTGKYPIAIFIELMFIVAPDFDEYPLINFILKDREIAPNDRIDRAIEEMSEQRWENAKRRSEYNWQAENEERR